MKKYVHKTPSAHKTTMDIGLLYPIQFLDVMAGQTTYLNTSALVRFQPLVAPAFVKMNMHIAYFFVPYRLMWDGWLDFISGVKKTELPLCRLYSDNPIETLNWDVSQTTLAYSGWSNSFITSNKVNLNFPWLWYLAYHKIWNDHFRDTMSGVQPEVDIDALRKKFEAGINLGGQGQPETIKKLNELFGLRRVNWGRDRFTRALLETDADPSVKLPIGSDGVMHYTTQNNGGDLTLFRGSNSLVGAVGTIPSQHDVPFVYKSGLSGVDMSDFKLASSIWNFLQNKNIYGNDVKGYFKKYGLRDIDSRIQNSEFIGGFAEAMQISDIIATDSTDLGKQGGHAIGYAKRRAFKHYAPEHGVIITMAYIRPQADYTGGIPRFCMRRDMLDFFQAEFADIGYQPIYKEEIGIAKVDPVLPVDENEFNIFGYEPRYNDMRSEMDLVTGELSPNGNHAHWANPRTWSTSPNLNSEFLECKPSNQIWASPNTDKAIVYFDRRVAKSCFLPKFSDPRIKLN